MFPYDKGLRKRRSLRAKMGDGGGPVATKTNHVFPDLGGNSSVIACNERPTGSFAADGLPQICWRDGDLWKSVEGSGCA